MSKIKLINKNTNLKEVLHPLNWDVIIKGEPYIAFFAYYYDPETGERIEYNHSEGSRYDNVWCCPRNEEPTYENILQFDGHPCSWGINIQEKNYYRNKWDVCECNGIIFVQILRNGEVFDEFGCHDMSYGLAKAQLRIAEYQEFPIPLNDFNYKDEIVGRKIRYKGIPSIIERYVEGQACIIIKPLYKEDINKFFSDPNQSDDEYVEDYFEECKMEGNIKTELTSPHIWWWYNEK